MEERKDEVLCQRFCLLCEPKKEEEEREERKNSKSLSQRSVTSGAREEV
jgi:hypothetical protein